MRFIPAVQERPAAVYTLDDEPVRAVPADEPRRPARRPRPVPSGSNPAATVVLLIALGLFALSGLIACAGLVLPALRR
jgi:hypothetical protein